MYEHRHQPLASWRTFRTRQLHSAGVAACVVGPSLGLGMFGYHFFARLSWIDALLNASMILTGMGPVDPLQSVGAKLFASFYALFSGIVFITTAGVLLAPVLHRFLHKFHLDIEPQTGGKMPERRQKE